MKGLILFFFTLLTLGCNTNHSETDAAKTDKENDQQKITAKDIEKLNVTEYVLGPEAREAVVSWNGYQELMSQIEFLKKAELSFFDGKNELLINSLKDLKEGIPKNLAIPAIKERLIALDTKILKLHGTLKLQQAGKKEVLGNVKEVLVAVSNLQLQINKKFEFESQIIVHPSGS